MAEIIGIASGIASLVTLIAQITQLSYAYISDIRTAPRVQKQYLREVTALTDVLLRAEDVAQSAENIKPVSQRPISLSEEIIQDCMTELECLRVELEKHPRRFLWVIREPELKKQIEALQRFRSIFSDFISTHTLVTSTATYREVSKLSAYQDRKALLDWVQNSNDTSKPPPIAYPGTGKWFLECEAYCKWLEEGEPSVLWCHGAPGVGKSTIASIILQDLSKSQLDHNCVVHYFCDFSKRKQQNKTAILRSLVEQVIRQGDETVIEALMRHVEELKINRPPNFTELLAALSTACIVRKVFVILDGLDELENPRDIHSCLDSIISRCKVVVISRDVPDVRSALPTANQMIIQADRHDLTTFIAGRFQESDIGNLMSRANGFISEIVDRANGIFLLARLLVDQLTDLTTIKEMRAAVRSFPSKLEEAFQSTVTRIDSQSKSRSDLAHRAIGWITHSERRLNMVELIHGLAVTENDEEVDEENFTTADTILKVCVGLLTINREDNTVGMVHTTAYEWFRNHRPEHYHKDLARSCLLYLTSRPMSTGACGSAEEMADRVRNMPFLKYAAQSWGRHIRTEEAERNFSGVIDRLLNYPTLRSASFQALHYRNWPNHDAFIKASFETMPTMHEALHVAAYWNLKLTAASLLSNGNNPSASDSQNWTPLHWACFNRSSEVVGILLSHGVNPNFQDSVGWTPIFWAALNGDLSIAQLLLDQRADHMLRDKHGWTALKWAMARQEIKVAECLLRQHVHCLQSLDLQPKKMLKSSNFQQLHQYSREYDLLQDMAVLPTELPSKDQLKDIRRLLQEMDMTSVDLRNFWSFSPCDPPIGNEWRLLNKFERIRGIESSLDVRDSADSRSWKAKFLCSAIKDSRLLAVRLLIELGADVNHRLDGRSRGTLLHIAAFRKDPHYAKMLLERGADASVYDAKGQTALHQAILNGFEQTAAALVQGGADVNARLDVSKGYRTDAGGNHSRQTPLMLACGLSRQDSDQGLLSRIIHLLLSNGADATAKDSNGVSVVHYAARSRDFFAIKQVIEAGGDCTALDNSGANVVKHFVLGHKFLKDKASTKQCVDLLIEHSTPNYLDQSFEKSGYRQNHEIHPDVHTPISLAIKLGDWKLWEVLQESGANMHPSCSLGHLLEKAIEQVQPAVVRFLIHQGATPPPGTNLSKTFESLRREQSDAVKCDRINSILVDIATQDLDVNLTDYSGETILHKVVTNVGSAHVTNILLDAGADPYKRDAEGLDSFLYACLSGNSESLRCLLARDYHSKGHWTQSLPMSAISEDADMIDVVCIAIRHSGQINAIYGSCTLLCHAIRAKNEHLIKTLLNNGADPSIPSNGNGYKWYRIQDGWRPVHLAADQGNANLMEQLLSRGADPEIEDNHGRRPIHLAAAGGYTAIINQLLFNKCDHEAADKYGWHAIHFAAYAGSIDVVRSLVEAGANVHSKTKQWSNFYDWKRPSGLYSGDSWTGQALHLAAMAASRPVVSLLLEAGVDVNASSHDFVEKPKYWARGRGPRALDVTLNTGQFYGRSTRPLSQECLDVAWMLVEKGANVNEAADHLNLEDVMRFEHHQELWERLREGIQA
ncbi:MAG: hypothetical protein M1820_001929 [Bogoriella megaspora]|nr:MAG: hypothetical protein M1820_001929 [Bogoriella megaspora]